MNILKFILKAILAAAIVILMSMSFYLLFSGLVGRFFSGLAAKSIYGNIALLISFVLSNLIYYKFISKTAIGIRGGKK